MPATTIAGMRNHRRVAVLLALGALIEPAWARAQLDEEFIPEEDFVPEPPSPDEPPAPPPIVKPAPLPTVKPAPAPPTKPAPSVAPTKIAPTPVSPTTAPLPKPVAPSLKPPSPAPPEPRSPALLAPDLSIEPRSAPSSSTAPSVGGKAPAPTAPIPPPPAHSLRAAEEQHSPEWTQHRIFAGTYLWRLDRGALDVETRFRARFQQERSGFRDPAEFRLQQGVAIGILPRVQLNFYENITFDVERDSAERGIQHEGNDIEARIALPRYYGQIFGNPVVSLGWQPRHGKADRAEVRLLLGQEFLRGRLVVAANPYLEMNVDKVGSSTKFVADAGFGTTVAAGWKTTEWLRLSGELRIGAHMLDDHDNNFHFAAWIGPGFFIEPLRGAYRRYLKIAGLMLVAVPGTYERAAQFEPLITISSSIF